MHEEIEKKIKKMRCEGGAGSRQGVQK